MDLETIRNYALAKKGTTEEFPFGEDTPVYKVMGKIYIIGSMEPPCSISLKCDPEQAVDIRERYPAVSGAYHMNKTHWNTVELDGSIPAKKIFEWIDHSYELVKAGLKRADREKLK